MFLFSILKYIIDSGGQHQDHPVNVVVNNNIALPIPVPTPNHVPINDPIPVHLLWTSFEHFIAWIKATVMHII